jgi:hypothetical protein
VLSMALARASSGNTLADLKAYKRSRIMATATMEQRIKGQMGHPAACMMLNKINLSRSESVLIMADGIVIEFCG